MRLLNKTGLDHNWNNLKRREQGKRRGRDCDYVNNPTKKKKIQWLFIVSPGICRQ